MTITAAHRSPTPAQTSLEPTGTYLPDDVVAALCLLAVPASRRDAHAASVAAVAQDAGTSPTVTGATGATASTKATGGARGRGPRDRRRPLPHEFAPRTWEVIPRELTEAGFTVLLDELAGRPPREEARSTVAAEELAVIEATERVHAWLDLVALGAVRRFREAVGHEVDQAAARVFMAGGKPFDEQAEGDSIAVDEIALVTGHTISATRSRLRLACLDDGRATVVLARLAEGRTTLDRATRILDATVDLHPETVRIISDRVLAPMTDGSLAPHRVFVRRLHRQMVLHQMDRRTRHASALRRRTAFGELHDDGTGTLTVVGDGPRVTAALDRVEDIARSLKAGGDQRSLDALRSDVTLDLLLVGWPVAPPSAARPTGAARRDDRPAAAPGPDTDRSGAPDPRDTNDTTASPTDTRPPADAATDTHPPADAATDAEDVDVDVDADNSDAENDGADEDPEPGDLVDLGPWWALAVAPPAVVHVVVSLTSLLGLEDGTAELPGHGFVTAELARQVALAEGSVWRRLVTDPLTGTALDLSTQRYRPTPAMAERVAALDGHCRAPGCTVPAERCDLDHLTPWPRGETSVRNLRATHRRHHNHKTRGLWRSDEPDDGDLAVTGNGGSRWRTVGGREYLTERYRYEDPTHHEPGDDERARVNDIEPPPF